MLDFIFQIPRKIEIGFSKSGDIAKIIKEIELQRVLVVVDCNLKKLGVVDQMFNNLKKENISFTVFDNIKNEPTIAEIDQAIHDLKVASNFDGVVGIGGGSTIDVAKLLAVSGSIKGSIRDYLGINLIKESSIPAIMVPTTSGTGAEVTPNAVVKDPVEGWKKGIVSTFLIPDRVILDPELTISLPPKITAETGIDAFTHAIECFICNKSNLMSDLFALDSMRLINNYLRRAVRNGNDKEARYYMAIGSLYGGIAITNSGTGGVHALAYPLGGKYNISHGLSNSILLAEVMEFNAEAVPEKFIKVADVMEIETTNFTK
ncbi:MAG: iron-containing alcohol dehydrogenase, partial [Candidatus Atribacteria bacterium]|nr:iron-containing alcohol dehydrogenase [Candidatus Atribacteria bacterium]